MAGEPEDAGALRERVRALELRADEDRRTASAMIAELRNDMRVNVGELRTDLDTRYLTADQTSIRYVSRDDARRGRASGRERVLIACALTGSFAGLASVLVTIIERIAGH